MALKRIAQGSIIVFYVLIALEIIIMISPFALYFYSAYGPMLKGFYVFPLTGWLTGFFLPHMVFSDDPFLTILSYLGPILFGLGLIIFFICALQVYYAKLRKRGMVTEGIYSTIRHPQYLGLAISGLGLLLLWPRFFILIMYITMLFIYYLLAQDEEKRMERKFGDDYREYKSRTSMFLPGNPGARFFLWIPGSTTKRGLALLVSYILLLSGGTGVGFALREYTKSQIPILYLPDMAVISVVPMDEGELESIIEIALGDERVVSELSKLKQREEMSYSAYIMPINFMMQGLIAEVGMKHLKKGKRRGVHLGVGKLTEGIRVIFSKVVSLDGGYVSPTKALDIRVRRIPLFFADIDTEEGKVVQVMETLPRHHWGDMPMPVF